ncbi:MAG: SdrD B-like domain-containing protein [Planctomycetota bacterium]
MTWHSIDGDIAVGDQSTHTTDDTERTGDDGQTGNPNNYEAIDTADITILSPTILKQVVSTGINNATNSDTQATIGEFITYSITIDVPEAGTPTAQIIDQLDAGLEFVSLDNIVTSASLSTDAAADDFATISNFDPAITGDGSSSTPYRLTFDLGSIQNSDTDNSVTEQITLTYTVKVMNSVDSDGNGSSPGDSLTNTARLEWNGGASQTSDSSAAIEVVEADLSVDKQLSSPSSADAGDTVVYTITISHSADSDTDAFDVTFSDTLPEEISFTSFIANHDSLGDISTLFEFDSGSNTLRTIAGQSFDQNYGDDVVIIVTGALITAETEPGETISNTASVQWTSLDNDNPVGGDATNERGGDGTGENDYNDSSTNTALSIRTPSVVKTLVGTGIDNANNGTNQAVIGETATYEVVLSLAEGTYNSLQLLDTLAGGYQFVSLDSIVRSTTNITTDLGTGDFSDLSTFNPSIGGGDHVFDLGTVTNAEDTAGDETLTITYTVRVTNTAGNDGNGSGTGTLLDNAAQLEWSADGSTTTSNTSSAVDVEVIEPDLAIVKTVNDDTPNLGDTVTFTLSIDHTAGSDTDAFDLVIGDTLPNDLVLDSGTIEVTLGGSTLTDGIDYTLATSSNGFTITGIDLPDNGQTLEVTYDADLTTDVADANNSYNNTGNLTWTSIDGSSANERDGDGGNGGEDDYSDSSTESLTITQPDLRVTKENGVAAVVPGSTYTYDIVVHNDGTDTATGINIQDILNGNVFDLTSVSTNDPSNVTYDSVSGELNWDASSINAGLSKTLEVTVTVLSSVDAGIDSVTNSATGTHDDIDPTNNNTGTDTDTVDANPILTLTKTDSRTEADLDDTLTYTLNYANTGNQTATGVQIIETVPAGTTFAGTAGWTDIGGGQYRFDVGTLAAGASGSVTFAVTVNDPQPVGQHTITNSATIDDDNTNGGIAGVDATATDDTDIPSSIAGRVYNDFDNDGVFDSGDGEHGIGGVRIELYDTSGGTPVFVGFTNTAADGTYSFNGLLGDQYEIRQTQPTNYNDGQDTDGSEANGDTSTNDQISNIELNAGIDATDYNFGERGVSVEGTVFVDDNRDGTQQSGETTGVSGVTVELYDSTGTVLLDTTTTDVNGNYAFDHLAADDYIIRQTHPTDYTSTSSDQISATVPLSGLTDQDFGEALWDLGNFVWFDSNNDGLQTGEEGIAGVDVTLTYAGPDGDILTTGDNIVYNTTTDTNGFYTFTELFNGNYTVEIDASDLPDGVTGTAETDDSSPAIDGTSNITVSDGDRLDVDFGFAGNGSIGDFVFLDVDGDGVQDPEDVGLADVTVNILFAGADGVFGNDDDLNFTTVTDSNGGYNIDNLPAGDFQVSVDTGDTDLPGSVTGISGTESNSGTVAVTLADNETNNDIDFGFAGTLSLGDRLWFDANGDGIQEPSNEPGLAEVDVTLTFAGQDGIFGNADDVTLTDTTDSNGNYQFDNLADGEYQVTYNSLDLPPGMTGTHEIDDTGTSIDGTSNITLNGSDRDDVDFGFQGSGSIGDFVWHDVDGDGVQDAGEPGLANITVNLDFAGDDGVFGTGDDFSLTTETDANGGYQFSNLLDGEYRVNVDTADSDLPENMTQIAGPESFSGTANVTLDGVNGRTQDDVDFGFAGTQSVGDFVWFDADGDGVQDASEPGLGDVTVTLTSAGQDGIFGNADDVTIVTTTDANGGYNFDLLPDGNYQVAIDTNDLPSGLTQTAETNDGTNSLAHTAEFAISGSDRDDIDFGYSGSLTIGDMVYFDADGNGAQNGGEPGVDGVDVTLNFAGEDGIFGTDDDFQLTTTTDANGNYSFENLPEGDYELTVDGLSLPDGMTTITQEYDDTGTANDGTATVTLTSGGGDNNNVDFGFMGTGSIGDTVFWDQNANGVEDPNEIGLAGVTVELDIDYDNDGTVDHTLTTTTDANGEYRFENLPAGEYTVRVTQPSGTTQTYDDDGLATPNQSTYNLGAGQDVDNKDFGYSGNSSIGDKVFFDYSGDGGAFNPGDNDRGIAGVDVTLEIDVDGDGTIDVTRTQTTDANGDYLFENLIAGDYTIRVDSGDLPDDMGLNPTFDSDSVTDHATDVVLGVNETNDTTDFGYHATPDYVITKDDGLSNVVPGQTINYTITLTNAGTFRGQNVIVTDTFPANILENVSATVNGIPGGNVDMIAGTITWNLPSVAMGEIVTIVVTADVINPLESGVVSLTNEVEVSDDAFNGIDPNTVNNFDDDVNTFTAQPDYQIVKTNDLTGSAVPGQTFNYFLQVTNNGNQEGTGITVTDTLPIDVLDALSVSTDDAANVVYDPTTGDLVWDAGSIDGGGASKTLTVTVTVQDPVNTLAVSFDNSASVTDDGNNGDDPDLTDNSSTNTAGLNATPDYEIVKTSSLTETAMVGDSFEYTITVTNIGDQDGTGVVVTDMIPVSILDRNNVTTDDPSNVSYDSTTGELIWNVGDLDGRGDSATLTIFVSIPFVVEDPLADVITNTATVADDGLNGPDLNPSNDSSTRQDDVLVFAFDGFNNFSDPVNAFSNKVSYYGEDGRTNDRVLRPIPVDPIFSGLAEPGTTLKLKIYDEQGNVIGERQVVADAGGNWVANFPNAVIWKHPHRMDVQQTAPIQSDIDQVDGFNMRRYFHPATHSSLFFSEQDTVHSIERNSAFETINSMHMANNSPIQVGWRNHLYQLNVSSTNASAR